MKSKNLDSDVCAIARSLEVIGDTWSFLIIRDAMGGFRRFGEFQKHLGIAKNLLAARLKFLVDHEVFKIVPAEDGSKYEEYALTKKGETFLPVLVALSQWGKAHLFEVGEICSYPVDSKKKRPFEKMKVRSTDGLDLELSDISMSNLMSKEEALKSIHRKKDRTSSKRKNIKREIV